MRGWAEVRVAIVITLLLACPLWAGQTEPNLTIDHDGRGGFLLNMHNPRPFPITVTVTSPRIENLLPSKNFPITAVVEAQERIMLAHLTLIRAREKTNVKTVFQYQPGRARAVHDDSVVYTLPFEAGCAFRVTQGYNGTYTHQNQHALDFAMPQGTPVCAARDGRVVSVTQKFSEGGTSARFKEKSNEFSILHADGTIARYAHLRKDGVNLLVGDEIRAGYPLGFSGNTGFSSGPHLHFDVIRVIDGEKFETVPVQFATADADAITLQARQTYMRPYRDQARGEHREPRNAADLAAPESPRGEIPANARLTILLAFVAACMFITIVRRIGRQ